MSKKKTNLDIMSMIKKGKELYDEYGETVLSVTKFFGKRKECVGISESVVDVDDKQMKELPAKDEGVVSEMQVVDKPTNLKAYRQAVEEDDSFRDSLATLEDSISFVYTGKMTPEDAQKALDALSAVAADTIRYAEEQETKREEIRAMRDLAIAKVNAVREVMQTYLEKTFDERATLFSEQFKCVDMALKNGDNEMLSKSLTSINTLATSSPFKSLADLNEVQKALTSSETEWDI